MWTHDLVFFFLLQHNRKARSHNVKASGKGVVYAFLGVMLPASLFVHFLVSSISKESVSVILGESGADYLFIYLVSPFKYFH